ncbi:MAG: glycerol dehydratase reactivase beta/small subunit family protein [Deltaproteobacteria bacterium]|nr:glycerol dehydratase reactivase beta/small subunit family protein [Deltaproteobacteria bacterium]
MKPFREQTDKVAVWIFGFQPLPEGIIEPILWGLEEEGIPGDIRQVARERAENMAKQAADGSPLNVGIGINGSDRAVALHHRDLPGPRPLFLLGAQDLTPANLRCLGVNAARLVKAEPLVFPDTANPGAESRSGIQLPKEVLDKIVALVVANIPSNKMKGRHDSWKSKASAS